MSFLPADPVAAYRRIRKDCPGLPAKQAWLWAKGAHRHADWKWRGAQGYLGISSASFQRDGFDITIRVSYDDSGYPRWKETDIDTGIRNPRFKWQEDEYGSRSHERYISLESDSTVRELAPYYNRAGAARNVAWEDARESLQKEADGLLDDAHASYVVDVTASRKGTELGSASVGGVECDEYQTAEDAAAEVADDLIDEAIEEARKQLAELLATA